MAGGWRVGGLDEKLANYKANHLLLVLLACCFADGLLWRFSRCMRHAEQRVSPARLTHSVRHTGTRKGRKEQVGTTPWAVLNSQPNGTGRARARYPYTRPIAMSLEAHIAELHERRSLLRRRIASRFMHVRAVAASEAEFQRIDVNRGSFPQWDGEAVIIWYRQQNGVVMGWAVQEACPHAGISLAISDIEDFPPSCGPCIACPAHMVCTSKMGSTPHCSTHTRSPYPSRPWERLADAL